MNELLETLELNNILLSSKIERQEYEYYTLNVVKKKNIYIINPNQPILERIDFKFNIVHGNIVVTTYEFLQLKELVELEQGRVIVETIN